VISGVGEALVLPELEEADRSAQAREVDDGCELEWGVHSAQAADVVLEVG